MRLGLREVQRGAAQTTGAHANVLEAPVRTLLPGARNPEGRPCPGEAEWGGLKGPLLQGDDAQDFPSSEIPPYWKMPRAHSASSPGRVGGRHMFKLNSLVLK